MSNTSTRVRQLMVEMIGLNDAVINPDTRLKEDLGLNVLDIAELTMVLEEEFGREMGDEGELVFDSFGELVVTIDQYRKTEPLPIRPALPSIGRPADFGQVEQALEEEE